MIKIKYPNDFINQIICGKCEVVLKAFPDNCIDTIITDPPYGLSFMGKKWDYQVPSIEIWQECLRVLKPGGTALIFAGSRTQHRMAVNVEDAGFILKDCIMYLYGSGFPKATDIGKKVKDFVGWKSHGLKPAYEPILVCMKPNEGSYANNALKWGVAGLNIGDSRIETNSADPNIRINKVINAEVDNRFLGQMHPPSETKPHTFNKGRYPANIILDDEAGRLLDEISGNSKPTYRKGNKASKKAIFGFAKERIDLRNEGYHDTGGASRFFYCAKSSKAERNRGCEKNHHPTVKPLALMKYLCTITKTPTGGIVLDPFCGSGTTLMACKETGRDYIGIEKDKEYVDIARKRISSIPASLF